MVLFMVMLDRKCMFRTKLVGGELLARSGKLTRSVGNMLVVYNSYAAVRFTGMIWMVFQAPNSTIGVLLDSENSLSAFGTNTRQVNLTSPIAKPHPRKYLKQLFCSLYYSYMTYKFLQIIVFNLILILKYFQVYPPWFFKGDWLCRS